jgi:rod shape-determining protein MreB
LAAGAKQVYVAKEPILAAIGAGIPINSCSGHMIINIGGGTSEILREILSKMIIDKQNYQPAVNH